MIIVSPVKQVAEHKAIHPGTHKKYNDPLATQTDMHPVQHPGAAGPHLVITIIKQTRRDVVRVFIKVFIVELSK